MSRLFIDIMCPYKEEINIIYSFLLKEKIFKNSKIRKYINFIHIFSKNEIEIDYFIKLALVFPKITFEIGNIIIKDNIFIRKVK